MRDFSICLFEFLGLLIGLLDACLCPGLCHPRGLDDKGFSVRPSRGGSAHVFVEKRGTFDKLVVVPMPTRRCFEKWTLPTGVCHGTRRRGRVRVVLRRGVRGFRN